MQQQPPEKIDKYQILSVLGKGAMGVVYHAYDPAVKRDVAIKLLSSLDLEETELVSRFEREARLAGSLRHPNIVTIYDLGHFENRPYIVMEYIVGKDLEAVIKERQELPFEQKADIILQICKGLQAAHQKGIIHRDIKPANIRIQEDNTVKIMDFGIARMGASQLTRSGYIIGTLQYMSPEQISGEALDPRTDVFSTGVIAYELFMHNNPFTGGGAVDIMYRILNIRPHPITDLPEEFASELNQIVMRALEKNKDLRYPGAKDMAQDLEEFLFYVKTIRLRPRLTTREREPKPVAESTTIIPPDQLPVTPQRIRDVPPTVGLDLKKELIPELTKSEPQKAPRTGLGANYSETAQQVLMKHRQTQPSTWQEKKVYILGAILTLLMVGGYLAWMFLRPQVTPQPDILAVTSTPAGAEVWADGQLLGKTPFQINGKKDLMIVFKLTGYKDKPMSLSREAWPLEVNVNLDKVAIVAGPKIIHVESTPPGGTVLLDGESAGPAPARVTLNDEKQHELIVRLDGYQEGKRTIDRTTSENLNITLQQAAEPGFVRYLFSDPVVVYSSGKVLKGNPISLLPGSYTLTFRGKSPAYIKKSTKVEIMPGETVTINQPAMGSISIKANPSNCKISIDGEYIDESPILGLRIQSGSYMIQFNWPAQDKKLSKPVTIEPGQSVTVTGKPE